MQTSFSRSGACIIFLELVLLRTCSKETNIWKFIDIPKRLLLVPIFFWQTRREFSEKGLSEIHVSDEIYASEYMYTQISLHIGMQGTVLLIGFTNFIFSIKHKMISRTILSVDWLHKYQIFHQMAPETQNIACSRYVSKGHMNHDKSIWDTP